ncbi:MAG TPA: luciferase family protein [Candidatus Limnocylindrales bacterium]|nr:luciferase family protein [Candidatus Limnocylindrales bacterium]
MSQPLQPRRGPRPAVHQGMPHAQVGVTPVAEVNAELHRRAFSLPGVSARPTIVSIPGSRALWLDEGTPLARPEMVVAGREFTHIHPDGSMHLPLPPERAREAIEAGWAEEHPIARQLGIDGLVLVYTPRDFDELEVLWDLVLDSYTFVTGQPRPGLRAS